MVANVIKRRDEWTERLAGVQEFADRYRESNKYYEHSFRDKSDEPQITVKNY